MWPPFSPRLHRPPMAIRRLKPAIAAVLAVAILSQPLTLIQVLAIVAICGSVLIEFAYQAAGKIRATKSDVVKRGDAKETALVTE